MLFGYTGMLILILIDIQYSQLFLALKKVGILKITPPQVPFGKKSPPKNFQFPPHWGEFSPTPYRNLENPDPVPSFKSN